MDNQQMLEGCCSTDYIISYTAKILKKVKKTKFFNKKNLANGKNIHRLGKLKKMRFRIANFLYYIE